MSSPISRNALASGSRIWVLQELLILCIANILHNAMQLVLGVYASPVTADRPHRTILKNRIILSQRSRAIGLQLVSNNITAMRICGNNNMNVIRTSVGNPKMPRTNEAMFSNHRFNSGATIIIEQMNWILQSIRPPRFQQRLRWHIPFAVFSPTSECPLNMSSVGSPSNEVCQWRIVVHRSHLEHVSNYRNLDRNLIDFARWGIGTLWRLRKPGASALRLIGPDRKAISRNALASGFQRSNRTNIVDPSRQPGASALRLMVWQGGGK